MARPLIAVTMGDPAGIGPEVVLKACSNRSLRARCTPVVFGDAAWLERNRRLLRSHPAEKLVIATVSDPSQARNAPRHVLPVIDLGNVTPSRCRFGRVSAEAGRASGDYVVAAVEAVRKGRATALVTAPINKESFLLGGWGKKYVGHTEMLAALAGGVDVRLMLAHGRLRAVHVTSHIPLRDVPRTLSTGLIARTISITDQALRRLLGRKARIAVCGLNPHAGDGGVLGLEERKIIAPAVSVVRRRGVRVEGPLSADAVWPQVLSGRFDVGIAMYHDQGQIAVKLAGIGDGVNVTLGLPFVRTSPAHGTAFDIAGKGAASERSFLAAALTAVSMVERG